ncbi:MAG: hypothetical protein WBA07_18455 [Rivularia sp. (in: cyanobacteria)]
MRSELSKVLSIPAFPQLILRLGFGRKVKPTPRREVDEVLI